MEMQLALSQLKEFIHYVESKPALADANESSLLNDFLRRFVQSVNLVNKPMSKGFCRLDIFFGRLPEDLQYNVLSFLNVSSLAHVAQISHFFHQYTKNQFMSRFPLDLGFYLCVGDKCDVLDTDGKWCAAEVVQSSSCSIFVRFPEWSDKPNHWVERNSKVFAPHRSRSRFIRPPQRPIQLQNVQGPVIIVLPGAPGQPVNVPQLLAAAAAARAGGAGVAAPVAPIAAAAAPVLPAAAAAAAAAPAPARAAPVFRPAQPLLTQLALPAAAPAPPAAPAVAALPAMPTSPNTLARSLQHPEVNALMNLAPLVQLPPNMVAQTPAVTRTPITPSAVDARVAPVRRGLHMPLRGRQPTLTPPVAIPARDLVDAQTSPISPLRLDSDSDSDSDLDSARSSSLSTSSRSSASPSSSPVSPASSCSSVSSPPYLSLNSSPSSPPMSPLSLSPSLSPFTAPVSPPSPPMSPALAAVPSTTPPPRPTFQMVRPLPSSTTTTAPTVPAPVVADSAAVPATAGLVRPNRPVFAPARRFIPSSAGVPAGMTASSIHVVPAVVKPNNDSASVSNSASPSQSPLSEPASNSPNSITAV